MLKTTCKLEVKVGDRSYLLLCDYDAPLHELKDVICSMQNYVLRRIEDSEKEIEKQEVKEDV